MSFASAARSEIAARQPAGDRALRAACYGLACFAKRFDANGLLIQTEQEQTAGYARRCFAGCGIGGAVRCRDHASGPVYEFCIDAPDEAARMHALFGTTGRELSLQIDPRLLEGRGCLGAYIGAAFLCCGTVTDPQKEYHLEFMTGRLNLAKDFEALLAEHEFRPHRTRRKGMNVVYLKASEPIEDILTFMGATGGAMEMMNRKVYKELRNKTNRLNNCDTANMDKTATANVQALRAIAFLEENDALDALPDTLRQAAAMRRQYPDLPLAALAARFDPPISKSGLSHRFKKLESIAAQMQEKQKP